MAPSNAFKPEIENPYPGTFETVSDFKYRTRLVLVRLPEALRDRQLAKASYILGADYTVTFAVDGEPRELTVPRGMRSDLASVPWGARNTVGRVGPHLEAAIVHDFLFIAWQLLGADYGPRRSDFRYANAVMFAGLEAADTGWLRQTAIKAALNFPWVAWSVFKERDDEDSALFVDLDRMDDGPPAAST
jgi:hypothetical protein